MGEDQLIAQMRALLPVGERTLVWSGDDCAEVATPSGSFLISTDVLVENVHFRLDWSNAFEIGQRAAAQNLADIMAQGGVPTALVVSLVIPPHVEADWLTDLVAGFAARVKETSAGVVGGDISKGQQLVIAVTVCGETVTKKLPGSVTRGGARPKDRIAVAGTLGYSYAGYLLLQAGLQAPQWEPYISIFKAPQPPLTAGPAAALAGATAMLDISDGLSTDAARLAKASNAKFVLSKEALQRFAEQLEPAANALRKPALEMVLSGGEDHALLACFPPEVALPTGFVQIGQVEPGPAEVWLDEDKLAASGWDHFGR
ncbi:MAG: thiamine-phosphate kinase [Actinomycetaceae bacterium]|nr:thiamine-phosphate kinase [Actinomycetaceae bacterium]